jgi:hypothetical protein
MDRVDGLAALAGFPARVATAARAAVDRPVADGEWGPDLVVRHLIAVEIDVHQARLADLDGGGEPHWTWTEPGPWPGDPGLSMDALLARFAAARASTLATLTTMDDADWARGGVHASFGRLDVGGLVRNAIDHDEEHLRALG